MPDEVGTETTRSDVPSADESLFGDAADDAAAAVAEGHDADKETGQDPQGSDDPEGEAGASETDAPEDLKVVVSVKGGRATQIHRLVAKGGLVGASGKAGYDGSQQKQPITNEVHPLCSRERFLSTTQRRTSRQG